MTWSIRALEAECTKIEAMLRAAGLTVGETRISFILDKPRPIDLQNVRIADGLYGRWVKQEAGGMVIEVKASDLRRVIAERGGR